MKKPGSEKNDASILIGEGEIMAIHMVETETYPFSFFVSDAGGAGGLFLGLSLLSKFFLIFIRRRFNATATLRLCSAQLGLNKH